LCAPAYAIDGTQYLCSDGIKLTVEFKQMKNEYCVDWPHAVLHLDNQQLQLPHVTAANGEKFSNEKTTFWVSGYDAMLYSESNNELAEFLQINKTSSSNNNFLLCSMMTNINLEDVAKGESDKFSTGCNDSSLVKKYAGSYKKYSLLNEPDVKPELVRLFGKELDHLLKIINGSVPIYLKSCDICIEGYRKLYRELAIVCINLTGIKTKSSDNLVYAAIQSGDKITVYSDIHKYSSLPHSIRTWIDSILHYHYKKRAPLFNQQPENVVFFNTQ
jgi:membrane-bound inhibitor of C-type lysozyme